MNFEELTSHCIFQGGRLLRYKCPACDVIFGPEKMFALDDEMLQLEYKLLYSIYSEGDSTASTIREALGNKVVKRSLHSDLFLMNVLGAD